MPSATSAPASAGLPLHWSSSAPMPLPFEKLLCEDAPRFRFVMQPRVTES